MKILHTSDLHIGKRLYHVDMLEDQQAFFDWLVALITKEEVKVLLISGDIFDVANPSSEARRLYYELLVKLSELKCKVIITGGNHDSPAVLEAPKEVLKALDIHVVGSRTESLEGMLIPLSATGEKPEGVAAIPFLRDRDLRAMMEGETYSDRLEAIKSGILKTYHDTAVLCEKQYPATPAIAMGHLFVNKGRGTESERDVQVGNQAGVDDKKFPDYFSYYALGHLHTPQESGESNNIIYSGSPYPLSFSEKDNVSRVMLLTAENGDITSESIEIPIFRQLVKYSGTLEEVQTLLKNHDPCTSKFKTLLELEILEENYNPEVLTKLETLEEEFENEGSQIVKSRVRFINKIKGTDEMYSVEKNIEDLAPKDVFLKRLESEDLSDDTKDLLIEAFDEILEKVLQES